MNLRGEQKLLGAFCKKYFWKNKENFHVIISLIREQMVYVYSANKQPERDPTQYRNMGLERARLWTLTRKWFNGLMSTWIKTVVDWNWGHSGPSSFRCCVSSVSFSEATGDMFSANTLAAYFL